MKPRRYQLTKDAASIIARGHPWLFRDSLSSAAQIFTDGDLLRLVDGTNTVVGWGTYEAEGAIAIRVIRRAAARPDAAWLRAALDASINRRAALAPRTTGIRLVHGESDGIPAVVADQFGDTIVVSSYATGADAYARFIARSLRARAANILLKPAHRRHGAPSSTPHTIAGTPPAVATFVEDALAFSVDLAEGQKTGTYLDLRGLRHAIATTPLTNARVLNLFAYTGMLGRAAEAAGATAITHVDQSARALAFARAHHATDPARHTYVEADIFHWLPTLDAAAHFDLVIVDPPAMTSKKQQVPQVIAAYKKLYKAAATHVAPGGIVVAACCTSRIERPIFHRTVRDALGTDFVMERELAPEPDHPVTFPQGDYLKIGWWRRAASTR